MEGSEQMTEKPLDFSKYPKFDEYEPLKLDVLGEKEVVRKSDNKHYRVLICKDDQGRQVDIFDWATCERDGQAFVLRKHLRSALAAAK
jgi:hypothetical protein